MNGTGRIERGLDDDLRRLVFKLPSDEAMKRELRLIQRVDEAHVLMLVKQKLMSTEDAAALFTAASRARESDFLAFIGRVPERGLYLMYERYLIDATDDTIGGRLQLGRSRNDLSATISRLKLRDLLLRLSGAVIGFARGAYERSNEHLTTTMPAYTHYQAAMPGTLGHYLKGTVDAVLRDLEAIHQLASYANSSPLGAGAGSGTTLEIDREYTAGLLGFTQVIENSIDAVASRDHHLRVLSVAGTLGVLLSRIAQDLILWSTTEFGFIRFPDQLVGSSSMMPQKRNPFLLEHVKGKSASPLAALQRSAMAMHAVPFGNSVAVGTEGAVGVEEAIEDIVSCLSLLEAHVRLFEAFPETMLERAERAGVCATAIAEHLARDGGVPFRSAHHQVGALISEAEEASVPLVPHVLSGLETRFSLPARGEFSPDRVVRRTRFGGGAGHIDDPAHPRSAPSMLASLEAERLGLEEIWAAADVRREELVRALLD